MTSAELRIALERDDVEKVWRWFEEQSEPVLDIDRVREGLTLIDKDVAKMGFCIVWLEKNGYLKVIELYPGSQREIIIRPTIWLSWQEKQDCDEIVFAFKSVGLELASNGEDIRISGKTDAPSICEEEREMLEKNKPELAKYLVERGKIARKGTEKFH